MGEEDVKLGVSETQEMLDLAVGMANAGIAIADDGKVDMNDLAHVMALLPKIQPAISGASKIPAELGDLDESEAKQLISHVMSNLQVDEAKALNIVDKALKAAAASFSLVQAIRA